MRRLHPVVVGALMALLFAVSSARAQFGYTFLMNGGSQLPLNSPMMIFDGAGQAGRGGFNDQVSGGLDIGFAFNFNGATYNQFSVSTNGLIGLGGDWVTSTSFNSLAESPNYPILAPFWDEMRVSGGAGGCGTPMIRTALLGDEPNRIRVIDFNQVELIRHLNGGNNNPWGTFQVRLYERSNRIEFWYGKMSACDLCNRSGACGSTSATIGIAGGPDQLLSVTPGTGASTTPDNDVDIQRTPIDVGTTYTFIPCNLQVTGIVGPTNGGTSGMNDGDVLFDGVSAQLGESSTYIPFVLNMTGDECTGSYTLSISGDAASDYKFTQNGTQFLEGSFDPADIDSIGIEVTPSAPGIRSATLDIVGENGFKRSYQLGVNTPFVSYTGFPAEGGTPRMLTGDSLFVGIGVPRHGTRSLTPFSLTNVGESGVQVSYAIAGGNGQYTIAPASAPIAGGETVTPTITFSPTGFGTQPAILTVTAGTEVRRFTLVAISAAPGGDFRFAADNRPIDGKTVYFNNQGGCVGDGPVSIPITVTNIGFNDFNITGAEFYETDTTYGQGRPEYAFRRDAAGNLVPMSDYLITETPVVGAVTPDQIHYPIAVAQGTTRTVYFTFLGATPGRRFAKGYLHTNGENFSGTDTGGIAVEGLLNLGLYGAANGAVLSDGTTRKPLHSLVFPVTKVGEANTATLKLTNAGACTLRVSMKDLQIASGDVKEFTIVTMPQSNLDPVTGDLLIAPNSTDQQIVVKFTPVHAGTRRATMVLRTNDSTIFFPGIGLRGALYLDLVGSTPTMLAATEADFGPALIGGGTIEQQHNVIHLENTSGFPVQIVKILIVGADSAEFTPDGTNGFPTLPRTVMAGERLDLKLTFAPQAGGQSGDRNARVRLVLATGDTIEAIVKGFAGTRVLDATPAAVTFATMLHGKTAHKTLTITNNGTIVMRITGLVLSNPTDFSVSSLARTELQPGQSEELDLSYSPSIAGSSTGTLTITSNAPANGGIALVTLNGTASKTRGVDFNDPSQTTSGTIGQIDGERQNDGTLSISGADGEVVAGGMTLRQSTPNPGHDIVEISYTLATRGQVELALFDGNGALVRVLEKGTREAGEGRIQVRVSDLPSGVYHYRLTAAGHTLSRTMTVVR